MRLFENNERFTKAFACLESYFQCCELEKDGWDISKRSKMKMNALLTAACQDSPECRVLEMRQSKKKFRDLLDNESLNPLADFLKDFANW